MKNKIITILMLIAAILIFSIKPKPSIDVTSKKALRLNKTIYTRLEKLDRDILFLARQLSQLDIIRRAQETQNAPVPAPAFLSPSYPSNFSPCLVFNGVR